jgi:V8-like Glu-specific endopeptidase
MCTGLAVLRAWCARHGAGPYLSGGSMSRPLLRFAVVATVLVLASGAQGFAQAPLKVGDVRPYRAETPHPYPLGTEAHPVVWTDTVISPGAEFVRVHFRNLHLAPGDYLTVSSPDGLQTWTYTGRGPHDNGDVWAFAIDGDAAVVRIHGGRGNGHGYLIDAVGHGSVALNPKHSPIPEVVCGTDGREDVACHLPEIDAAQRPVARLLFVSGGFQYVCTGELIAGSNANTLITNNHCIDTQTETSSLQARFNYQKTSCGGTGNATTTDYAGGTFLKTNTEKRRGSKGGLDYTLLTLLGSPEATWGELVGTTKTVNVGDLIWFIQHPGGNQKKVGYWEDGGQTARCNVDTINATYGNSAIGSQTGYACDSEGGSSGSAITDPATGHAIALHHYGGVSSNPCLNSGTAFTRICADAGSLLSCAGN